MNADPASSCAPRHRAEVRESGKEADPNRIRAERRVPPRTLVLPFVLWLSDSVLPLIVGDILNPLKKLFS